MVVRLSTCGSMSGGNDVTCREVSFSRMAPSPIFRARLNARLGVVVIAATVALVISSSVVVAVNRIGVADGLFNVPSLSYSNVVELPR